MKSLWSCEAVELGIVASLLSSGEPGVEGSGVLAALLANRLGDSA